ncbi:MAG: hypothetical protein EPO31_00535 [Gammaproteobacteria bacterium]|nr:MAG: hypothetical protein EPO31_00535 [Gammaproteobacteria bacterium]
MTEDLQRQIAVLTAFHKGLANIARHDADTVVSGTLPFEASADGLETITESFEIELTVPDAFPESLPRVRETGGRIGNDYEHHNASGTLCLAVPVEQRRIFLENPTLLGFVNRLVIPYLYGYCFWKKHGRHPFDEAAHGYEGILRHYLDTLGLADEAKALAVICYLFEHGYRGHHDCPCGSGLRVRACHGPALMILHRTHNQQTVRSDFVAIFEHCFAKFQDGQLSFPTPLRLQILRLFNRL